MTAINIWLFHLSMLFTCVESQVSHIDPSAESGAELVAICLLEIDQEHVAGVHAEIAYLLSEELDDKTLQEVLDAELALSEFQIETGAERAFLAALFELTDIALHQRLEDST